MVNFINIKIELALILLGLVLAFHSFSQDTVYINPSVSENTIDDGSREHPFDSWDDLHWSDKSYMNGKVFLQKCGTEFDVVKGGGYKLKNMADIVFGSYGQGKKPVIHSVADTLTWLFDVKWCRNIVFENIHFIGDTNIAGNPVTLSPVRVWGVLGHKKAEKGNIRIVNCESEYFEYGFRLMYTNNVAVDSCFIHHYGLQGIVAFSVWNADYGWNTIKDGNTKWYPGADQVYSQGACIAVGGKIYNNHIHHCLLDRHKTGNKFAIFLNADSTSCRPSIIEYNTVISPRDTKEKGAGIYICSRADSSIIRYNHFSGELGAIAVRTRLVHIYYNVFEGDYYGIDAPNDDGTFIYNNVFYKVQPCIKGDHITAMNNIFYVSEENKGYALQLKGINKIGYNCVNRPDKSINKSNLIVSDPQFIDPENGDFHLKASSPCIDKGTDVGLKYDKDGNPVPEGAGVDIGAYEVK